MAHVRFCRRADGREVIRLASDVRYLGEQRCSECNHFCQVVGLGGACPDCEQPILLSDLLDLELGSGLASVGTRSAEAMRTVASDPPFDWGSAGTQLASVRP